ncbi:MAG: LD-carboxypeptidase [Acidobacteriota bacterium]
MAALSGPVDPQRLEKGLRALQDLGYEPVPARNLGERRGLFAGDDRRRLDAFHELVDDDDLSAVVFARGGWGVLRLLGDLDWDLLARRPRAYVGYSDLTPFLLQVVAKLGVVAFHGPMVAADFARGLSPFEAASFEGALAGAYPTRLALTPVPGQAVEGPLLGGCLSLLAATLGTPWATDLEGAILVLEDLGEPPYRFDRMLTHLRLSGTLTRIQGVVVGHLTTDDEEEPSAWGGEVTLRGVLREHAARGGWPLSQGLAVGHASPNLTLPLGLWARLDPPAGTLQIEGGDRWGPAGRLGSPPPVSTHSS